MANPVLEELRTVRRKAKTSALLTCIGILGAVVMVSLPDRSPHSLFNPERGPVTAQVATGGAMLLGIAAAVIHLQDRQGLTDTGDWLSLGEISPGSVLRAAYTYAWSYGTLLWVVLLPVLLVGYNWVFVPAANQAAAIALIYLYVMSMALLAAGLTLALEDHPFISSLIIWALLAVRFLLTPGYAPALNPLLTILAALDGRGGFPWAALGLNLGLVALGLVAASYRVVVRMRRNTS